MLFTHFEFGEQTTSSPRSRPHINITLAWLPNYWHTLQTVFPSRQAKVFLPSECCFKICQVEHFSISFRNFHLPRYFEKFPHVIEIVQWSFRSCYFSGYQLKLFTSQLSTHCQITSESLARAGARPLVIFRHQVIGGRRQIPHA